MSLSDTPQWQKQGNTPLFPDLLWSRPEQKTAAGKLLVVGGNLHAFAAPAEAFSEAEKAGAGSVRVVLPDATKKIVGRIMEHVEYAPSTPSGSFAQQALSELLDISLWADGAMVAGDLGRNSETAILLEKYAAKYTGQLTITKDAVDYIISQPLIVSKRPATTLVMSFAQLQKLAVSLEFDHAFTFDMTLPNLVRALHELTKRFPFYVVVRHLDQTHIAVTGSVVSSKATNATDIWRIKTAAHTSVWWMQNPQKPLESLTTAVFEVRKP